METITIYVKSRNFLSVLRQTKNIELDHQDALDEPLQLKRTYKEHATKMFLVGGTKTI